MKIRLTSLFLLCATLLLAQAPKAVPVGEEPSHHLTIENEHTRVFKVEVAPGASTLWHRHDADYVFVTLGDARIENQRQGAEPAVQALKDGETHFAQGGFTHRVTDRSATPFRNITVEIKKKSTEMICGLPGKPQCPMTGGAGDTGAWTMTTLSETDAVRVVMTRLDPGVTTDVHAHTLPHLAVILDDLTFENRIQGQQPKTFTAKAGDVAWVSDKITHSFKNVGSKPGRIVAIEFK